MTIADVTTPNLPVSLVTYLRRFVARQRRAAVVAAFGWALAWTLAWMLCCCLVDRLAPLPAPVRLFLLMGNAGLIVTLVFRPLRGLIVNRNRIDWVSAAE